MSVPLDFSPALWLKLDDGSGTTPQDSSGNGNHAVFVNTPTWSGNVLDFQIADRDALSVDGELDRPDAITLMAWVNIDVADTGGTDIFSIAATYICRVDESGAFKGYYHFTGPGVYNSLDFTFTLAGKGWRYLAWVFDHANSRQELLINGVSVATAAFSDPVEWRPGFADTLIGRNQDGTANDIDGRVMGALVVPTALSVADVLACMLPTTNAPVARPSYVLPTFEGTAEYFRLLYSDDGLTFAESPSTLAPNIGTVRDPALFQWAGFYWMLYTSGSFGDSTSFGIAKAADWRGPYQWVADVDCSAITGVNRVWSPIPFVDPADDSLHVLFSASTDGSTFVQYHIEPADLVGLTTWGAPAAIAGVTDDYPNTLAGFIIRKGGTYYLWVKDESAAAGGGKYNVILSSDQPFAGYASFKTGDWAGWGQETFEGAYPVRIDATTWRVYMDHFTAGDGVYYSESTDDWETWTAPAPISAPGPAVRNGIALVTFEEPFSAGLVSGGAGHLRQRRLPWWWQSYFEQWLKELEEREKEIRRLKAKKEAEAAERLQDWLAGRPAVWAARAQQAALEQAKRHANAAELRKRVQGARDDRAAEQAALGQRAQGALSRVEARKQQLQAEAEAEELRKLRQIARSPHRRFRQRFEAAITAARRQGWRAKQPREDG